MNEKISLKGAPIGFGEPVTMVSAPSVAATSPWVLTVATSVIGAATGWVLEEIAQKVRRKRRR